MCGTPVHVMGKPWGRAHALPLLFLLFLPVPDPGAGLPVVVRVVLGPAEAGAGKAAGERTGR